MSGFLYNINNTKNYFLFIFLKINSEFIYGIKIIVKCRKEILKVEVGILMNGTRKNK